MTGAPPTNEAKASAPAGLHAALFLAVVLAAYTVFLHPLPGDNVNTRLDLAASLTNFRRIDIDPYHSNTIDKAFVGGHYYTDKAPGMSWWVFGAARASTALGKAGYIAPDSVVMRYVATLLIVSIPSALGALLLALLLLRMSGDRGLSFAVAAFYAFGTLAMPYSTMFYSHALTAALSTAVFYILYVHRARGRTLGPFGALLCGALAGAMTAGEYPAALTAGLLFVYSFTAVRRPWFTVFFLAGAAPFAAAVAIYNSAAFGNPFSTGYIHESLPGFHKAMNTGFAGMTVPSAAVIYKTLFSPGRGFFFQSPFLLLAVPGFMAMLPRGEIRAEAVLSILAALAAVAVGVSAFMPEGGMAVGPRYLIPALPFLCVGIVFIPCGRAWVRRLLFGLGLASMALMAVTTVTDPQPPREFDATIVEFCLPLLRMGLLRETIAELAPWALALIAAAAILVVAISANDCLSGRGGGAVEFVSALFIAAAFLAVFHRAGLAAGGGESAKVCAMGSYLSRAGNDERAAAWFARGEAAGGNNWVCVFGMARQALAAGDTAGAERRYSHLLRKGIAIPPVFVNLGDIYFKSDRFPGAVSMYESAAKAFIEERDFDSAAMVLVRAAAAAEKSGDAERADALYSRAAEISPRLVKKPKAAQ